ncbi:CD151 antigen-like [Ostrinia nubilalis]|uniref:CD151 antigen-like n=1 Tax=Ostrinia nubilalis TaxID=29057 RepID=UPI003082482D
MAEEKKKDGNALLGKKKKIKPRKSRDADCCSVNFLKCVLHIFNVVFLFAGIGVLAVGAWTVASRHRFVALLPTPTYPAIAYLLIIGGGLGIPLCALGCCGLKTENRTSLLCYTYFLLITFILEAGAGGLAYYYEVAVEDELRAELNNTFLSNYALDAIITDAVDLMQTEVAVEGELRAELNNTFLSNYALDAIITDAVDLMQTEVAVEGELRAELNNTFLSNYALDAIITDAVDLMQTEHNYYYEVAVEGELRAELNNTFLSNYALDAIITDAVDLMQTEFKCCGAVRYNDWRRSAWHEHDPRLLVPDSCCKTVATRCGTRDHPSNIYYMGCIRHFTNHIRDHLIILAAVGVGMSVIPIFGFLFSCVLYVKIKHVID